ncbi:MAG: DUF1573 domain-containing protein [Candidatus Firestonebacteria bacterium]
MKNFLKCIIILFLTCSANYSFAGPEIRLNKIAFDFGDVSSDKILEDTLIFKNTGDEVLKLKARVSCECVQIKPETFDIKKGAIAKAKVTFNPAKYSKKVTFYIFVDTNTTPSYVTLPIYANIIKTKNILPKANITPEKSSELSTPYELAIFYTLNCQYCRDLKEKIIPELETKNKIYIKIFSYPLNEPENYEKLLFLEEKLQDKNNKMPALLINGKLLGKDEIEKDFENELNKYIGNKNIVPILELFKDFKSSDANKLFSGKYKPLKFIPVILAGLLDGINPCAFTTLIFLLSYLTFAGKQKKEILLTGIAFTLAVFVTYFIVGLGGFSLIQSLSSFAIISKTIKWIGVLFAFIIGILNFYDYYLYKKGKISDNILQLPKFLKLKIHEKIRETSKSKLYFTSAFVLGLLVSLFELACTGQVYLPTIVYIVKATPFKVYGIAYLLLYNLMFILPLLIVFLLVYYGVTSEKLSSIFKVHLGKIKISLGIFFISLAILILFL